MDTAATPVIIRDNAGRFTPGTIANPNGRPTIPLEVRKLLEDAAPRAVQRLIELVESSDERIAATCSEAILNRLWGKPSQVVDAKIETNSIGQMHLDALAEINRRREARLAQEAAERAAAKASAEIVDITPAASEPVTDLVVGIVAADEDEEETDGN